MKLQILELRQAGSNLQKEKTKDEEIWNQIPFITSQTHICTLTV